MARVVGSLVYENAPIGASTGGRRRGWMMQTSENYVGQMVGNQGVEVSALVHGVFLFLADKYSKDGRERFQVFTDFDRGIHSHEFLTWCKACAGLTSAEVTKALDKLGSEPPTPGEFVKLANPDPGPPAKASQPRRREPPNKAANDQARADHLARMRALGLVE